MTKNLRKAIMTRSRLENNYQKSKTLEDWCNFKKHRNFCNRLNFKSKKMYYANLNCQKITDVRKFWKTAKPFLSDKGVGRQFKITLIKDNNIISADKEVAETLNSFFETAVKSLNIREPTEWISDSSHIVDNIEAIIEKYKNHPSITSIKENVIVSSLFYFESIDIAQIEEEIKAMNPKKYNPLNSVTASDIKNTVIFALYHCIL